MEESVGDRHSTCWVAGTMATSSRQFFKNDSVSVLNENSKMKNELEWLLEHDFKLLCEDVRKSLDECMRFIRKSRRGAAADINIDAPEDEEEDPVMLLEDSRMVSFSNPQKSLQGFVVIEGWNIEEAEFEVKFGKNKKLLAFKSGIKPSSPWRLKQIQSVYEYCKSGSQTISQILKSLSEAGSISPIKALQNIKSIIDTLCSAHSTLLLSTRSTQSPGFGPCTFHPALPPNVLVDFKIKQKTVVVTAALVKPIPKPSSEIKQSFFSLKQNQYFEILDQISTECETKKLETIFSFIQDCTVLCEEFKEKLQSLL